MDASRIRFEPDGTLLLGCEIPKDYDCKRPPKIGAVKPKLTRFPVFGLLVTHEYLIEQARIEGVSTHEGTVPDCKEAKRYDVTLRYWLSHKVKAKIPLLSLGTGDIEWISSSATEYWVLVHAKCVCCDPNYRRRPIKELPAHSNALAAFAMGAPGGAVGLARGYSWWQIGLLLAASAVALCLIVVLLRLIWPSLARSRIFPSA